MERAILKAIQDHPRSNLLVTFLAEVQDLRGKHAEAIDVYLRLLKQSNDNPVVLNNLAFLLAITDRDPAEALRLVNLAIDKAGPLADLLDTRAVVYLKRKQGEPAVQDMQQAVAQRESAPFYVHLAQARALKGDRAGAAQALQKAFAERFHLSELHALEQPELRQLAATLGLEKELRDTLDGKARP